MNEFKDIQRKTEMIKGPNWLFIDCFLFLHLFKTFPVIAELPLSDRVCPHLNNSHNRCFRSN